MGMNRQELAKVVEALQRTFSQNKIKQKEIALSVSGQSVISRKITVPTVDGAVSVTVPTGANTGTTLRLKGKGLPGTPAGDIFATLRIVNPKVTTEEARRVFELMAREVPFNPRAGIGG
mgnify:CR=1 FL=1